MKILVLNAGSSSQKSCLYEFKAEEPPIPSRPLWEADIDWSHRPGLAELKVATAQGRFAGRDAQVRIAIRGN